MPECSLCMLIHVSPWQIIFWSWCSHRFIFCFCFLFFLFHISVQPLSVWLSQAVPELEPALLSCHLCHMTGCEASVCVCVCVGRGVCAGEAGQGAARGVPVCRWKRVCSVLSEVAADCRSFGKSCESCGWCLSSVSSWLSPITSPREAWQPSLLCHWS